MPQIMPADTLCACHNLPHVFITSKTVTF